MIGSTGMQNAAPSFTSASVHADRQREKGKKDGSDAVTMLADFLKQKDGPDEADSLLKQLEQAKASLSQASGGSDPAADRKAAAREKIERIKARLQMLRLLAAINPEAAAKLAKQLARELAAAAKEYAAAGGGGAGAGVSVSVPNISVPSADASASTGGASGIAASTAAGAVAVAAQAGQAAPQPNAAPAATGADTAPEGQGQNADQAAQGAADAPDIAGSLSTEASKKGGGVSAPEETPQERREKERQSILDWANAQVGAIAQAGGAAQADSQFANDVRVIKSQLEAILEAAKRKLKLDQKPQANQDIKEAEGALRETEKALDAITGGVSVGLYSSVASVNITV